MNRTVCELPRAAARAELLDQTAHVPWLPRWVPVAGLLVHYFGTKDELIGQALAAARTNIPAVLAAHARAGHSSARMAERLWRDLTTGDEQEPRTRLLLEVMVKRPARDRLGPVPDRRPAMHRRRRTRPDHRRNQHRLTADNQPDHPHIGRTAHRGQLRASLRPQ